MSRGLPPVGDLRVDRRSAGAGYGLIAVIVALLVAASYPGATGVVVAIGVTLYGLSRTIRRAEFARCVQICRVRFCLRIQLGIG